MGGAWKRFRRTRPGQWVKRAFHLRDKTVVRIDIQPDVYIRVSWKDRENGRGPWAALHVDGEEVLRFDCFGVNRGHYHVYPARSHEDGDEQWHREFGDLTTDVQIELSVREIVEHAQRHLAGSASVAVRSVRLDPSRLTTASASMGYYMRQYAHAYRSLERQE